MKSKVNGFRINKSLVDEIFKIDNPTIGYLMKSEYEYIIKKEGEIGLKKVEARFKELGHPFKYNSLKENNYYPMGIRVLSLLIPKELFKWTDSDYRLIGQNACKLSLVLRLLTRLFVVPSVAVTKAGDLWRKHNKRGNLYAKDYHFPRKSLTLIIDDYQIHPIVLRFLEGYFSEMVKFLFSGKNTTLKIVKGNELGDTYHEWKVNWD